MTDNGSPKMSVIILTPHCYETIRKTMGCLRGQTVHHQLEIIVVMPAKDRLMGDELKWAGFKTVRAIEIDSMNSTARARATGVRHATASLVAFAEDHSYPDPHWAEALIARHREPWAAVGPTICNANPNSALSWTNLATEYGPWLDPVPGGPVDHLPGHNGSYKRNLLLAYESKLEAMLEAESVLHWDLRSKGHQLYLEPKAKTFHLNYSLLRPTIPLRFHGGRLFAASRGQSWPVIRRLFYAALSPLIPVVRARRILFDLHRAGQLRRLLPGLLPALALALASDAAGEMAGYLFGSGQAMRKLSDTEFDRRRFMNRSDKRTLDAERNAALVAE